MDWQTTGDPVEKEHLAVLLQRRYLDKVQLTLFEGGHEMITDRILDGVKGQNILVIGDSNGAITEGWGKSIEERTLPGFYLQLFHLREYHWL